MKALEYTSEFIRALKDLGKKYRSIKKDIEPLLKMLVQGETPGDRIPGVGCDAYNARVRLSFASKQSTFFAE